MGSNFLLNYYTFMAINALVFYTNYVFLVPVLFFRKKRYRYYIAALALVFCFYFLSDFANSQVNNYISETGNLEQLRAEQFNRPPGERRLPSPPLRPRFVIAVPHAQLIAYTSSSLLMIFFSLGLRLLERQSKIEKMHEEMEKANLNTELAFLKNQISPHFFFNTLNNIYSLVDRNAEDSKKAIIKLSKMMRYILNDPERDKKQLSDEIEFMNNYIDIMKLRIGEKTKLTVDFPAEYKDISIPPLLFISLIENAFKHGISVQEESNINISLTCDERYISFTCVNSLPESTNSTPLVSTGIGLGNLSKRLKLLFPDRHELKINKANDVFEARLTIQLQ